MQLCRATLSVRAAASTVARDSWTGVGDAGREFGAVGNDQRLGVAAVGIMGAADEGAELAEFKVQPSIFAGRAFAGVGAVLTLAEEMWAEQLIKLVENF